MTKRTPGRQAVIVHRAGQPLYEPTNTFELCTFTGGALNGRRVASHIEALMTLYGLLPEQAARWHDAMLSAAVRGKR
jgi:hypothetical protein